MRTQKFGLNRLQWILIGALVLQVILAIVVNLPRDTQATGGPLLEGFDPTTITEVWIENPSGGQIHLQKVAGDWVLPERGNHPVMGSNVTELLNKIENITTNRLVTQTEASHAQLMVAEDDFMSKVILAESGGKSQILYLGSSGGSGATHIRQAGHDQVYLTAELTSWEVTPTMSSWIDTSYLSLVQDQILGIRVENANGTFEFSKDAEGTWTYAGLADGDVFDVESFQTTAGRLSAIRMVETLGPEVDPSLGFGDPAATVVVEIQDETESTNQVTLMIGSELGGNYAVKSSSSPYYVKVSSTYVTSWVEMDHAGLLMVEPTPTPQP